MTLKFKKVHKVTPEELTQKIVCAIEKLISIIDEQKDKSYLLTPSEAAKFLKISKSTLNYLSHRGIVRKYKIGNLVRYNKIELEEAFISYAKSGFKY